MNTALIIGSFIFVGLWMWVGCEMYNAPEVDENENPIEKPKN